MSLSYSNRLMKTKVQCRKNKRSSKRNVCYTDQKTIEIISSRSAFNPFNTLLLKKNAPKTDENRPQL